MVNLDFDARIILDSMAPSRSRLTTMEVTFPRFLLAEFNTHRRFSRNAASSRAIPVKKRAAWAITNPVMPVEWGANKPGMQATELIDDDAIKLAELSWLAARNACVVAAQQLDELNVHKQIANRVIETWSWITVVVTATEWSNFFGLRCNVEAQPEIQKAAHLMRDEYVHMYDIIDEPTPEMLRLSYLMTVAYEDSRPTLFDVGDWHMPYLQDEDYQQFGDDTDDHNETLRKLSVARCARVSYLTQDGKRAPEKDIELHDRLATSGHMSPFEHVAQAAGRYDYNNWSGNFRGWDQYRKQIPNEER